MPLCPLQVVEDAPDASDPEFSEWFISKQIRHEAAWKQVAKQVAEDRKLAAVLQQEEQGSEPTSAPQSHTPNQVSARKRTCIHVGLDQCCGAAQAPNSKQHKLHDKRWSATNTKQIHCSAQNQTGQASSNNR